MQLTTNRQGFAPATLDEAMRFSDMLANSSMVPKAYQGKPQDILVCVQWGYEMGLAPMQALQNIAVINGKPSVYGDAAMALVQASPVCEDVEEYFENEGTANPIAVCVAKRKGRKPVVAKFSVEDAKRAGLWGKQGPWQAYPKRMMQMRARGFALRDAFPDVLKGLITAEEAQDYPAEGLSLNSPVNKRQPPANPLDALAAPATTSDPAVIAETFAHDIEAEDLANKKIDKGLQALDEAIDIAEKMLDQFEVVDIPEVPAQNEPAESAEPAAEPAAVGFPLMVPGKAEAFSIHPTLEEWQDAYENLAEKTAMAGKRPPRERMTLLRELQEANDATLKRVDTVKRVRHMANYSKRLAALGASIGEK
jgi:hypothetical protein